MVSLANAKRFLDVTGNDDDAMIERLLDACTAYLAGIGVTVDPMPAPVGEAVYLMVSVLHQRTGFDFGTRTHVTEGIGTSVRFGIDMIDDANWKIIRLLTDPYREASL